MKTTFKILFAIFLGLLSVRGDFNFTGTTLDIHLHDTYYVVDIKHILFVIVF